MQLNRVLSVHFLIAHLLLIAATTSAEDSFQLKRCEVVPLSEQQVSFRIDGVEKVVWHFDRQNVRPFFFPFNGPSGSSLSRMGHPGAPDHDHHQSIWMAHQFVNGVDFWSNNTGAQIRQKQWYCYQDSNEEAIMASALGWYDPMDNELMQQELIVALIPMEQDESALELAFTFKPSANRESVELGKTNFGFLAVRVAKSISAHFGGGQITSSEGLSGEPMLFAKPARWMDYSGPVPVGSGAQRTLTTEGITYFDHPANPRYPTSWHMREDGWMGAAFCLNDGFKITQSQPLVLRYLLHAHRGAYNHNRAEAVHQAFASRGALVLQPSTKKHLQFEVVRASAPTGNRP